MATQATDIEWGLLRSPILILILVLTLMIGLIGSSWYYRGYMQAKQKEADEIFKKISEEHKQSQAALADYQNFADEFKQLQQYYFLQAEERRNQWIERIRALEHWQDFFTITDVQSTDQPEVYTVSGVAVEKDFKIQLWKSHLQIHILHTGNLVDFIDHLYVAYPDGLYDIKACELNLTQSFDFKWQDNISEVGLDGYCILQWYTGEIQPEQSDK